MARENSTTVLVKVVGIMRSGASVVMPQYAPRLTNDLANLIEILLERLETDEIVNDEATILVVEYCVLRSRQMAVVMTLTGQIGKHIVKRPVTSGRTIFPPGDEAVPWIPDDGETKIPGRGRCIFLAQHSIIHEMPIWMIGIEVEGVNDGSPGAFSLVDKNAFISVTDHLIAT